MLPTARTARTSWLTRIATVALLAVGIALAGAAPGWAGEGTRPETISWHDCGPGLPAGLECGEIAVPLDYGDPRGPQISLGFDRLRAQDGAHRIGSLILNPGGPGGAGTEVVLAEAAGLGLWHPALARRFDLIGMDPRGVGTSTPVRCDPAVYNRPVSLFPESMAQFDRFAAYEHDLAASCRRLTGPLLGHVDTLSVARDLEALREALGDGKLNFLGLSYGAEIGTLYAELYPGRIRTMALDAVFDHSIPPSTLFAQSTVAYEDTFNRFTSWCRRATDCALHGRDVAVLFDRLAQQADRQPIAAPQCADGTCRPTVDGDDIRLNAYDYLLFKDGLAAIGQVGWRDLAAALAAAEAGDASGLSTRIQADSQNSLFSGLAVTCLDFPPLVSSYGDMVAVSRRARTLAPHTRGAGEAWAALTSCVDWPLPMVNPPHRARIRGTTNILLVNATHDPSTPYVMARNVLGQLPGAVLLTREGDGHTTSFLKHSRTNDAIADYLITGRRPAPGTVYPD
jgi:pimeloyl-ACP methyl ester carboxylesterase